MHLRPLPCRCGRAVRLRLRHGLRARQLKRTQFGAPRGRILCAGLRGSLHHEHRRFVGVALAEDLLRFDVALLLLLGGRALEHRDDGHAVKAAALLDALCDVECVDSLVVHSEPAR